MKWLRGSVRFLLVTVGVVALTSLGIDASQYLSGSSSALGILADRATEEACPEGMVALTRAGMADICIDAYELSVGDVCPVRKPLHTAQTAENIADPNCLAVSRPGVLPWTQVTHHQARALCARSGKRLLTSSEWYEMALGTGENGCVVSTAGVEETGSKLCVSGAGAHDAVGNVWEWVSDVVIEGSLGENTLPETGYVASVDRFGIALATAADPDPTYGEDYFWSDATGERPIMRGGFYGSDSDAGVYAVHAGVAMNFSGEAIGFRCAQESVK